MKLFYWDRSQALQLHTRGKIIVMADSLESARAIALEQAKTVYLGYSEMPELLASDDEDDQEEAEKKLSLLRADLEKEPTVYDDPTALFINGSE